MLNAAFFPGENRYEKLIMKNRLIREIKRQEYSELHIQYVPLPDETPEMFSEEISSILKKYEAGVIRATFFGRLDKKHSTLEFLKSKLSVTDFPLTWIEGDNYSDSFINGAYFFAVSGIDLKRLYKGSAVVGSYFMTRGAEFCLLGGMCSDPELIPVLQAESILNSAENILNQAGLNFIDTLRTWYYLDDITDWYDDFNKARNSFFLRHDIFNKRIPASTGIGGRNETGGKICLELTAVKQKNAGFSVEIVRSPMQCSATSYGSSFSRALYYSDGEYSNLTVSGTASISPDGVTMYKDDINKQIERTFTVVKAILESRGFTFSDIIRAYAYFSHKCFSKAFYNYCNACLPEDIAFICTGNKICRDDLLFEIDIDLIRTVTIT